MKNSEISNCFLGVMTGMICFGIPGFIIFGFGGLSIGSVGIFLGFFLGYIADQLETLNIQFYNHRNGK